VAATACAPQLAASTAAESTTAPQQHMKTLQHRGAQLSSTSQAQLSFLNTTMEQTSRPSQQRQFSGSGIGSQLQYYCDRTVFWSTTSIVGHQFRLVCRTENG